MRMRSMLDAATEIFGIHGYHPASMDQIARKAQISKPMLYAYFESKEGLFNACMRDAGKRLTDHVAASYAADRTVEQHLWDGFLAFFEFVGENPTAWRLISSRNLCDASSAREVSDEIQSDMRRLTADLIARASVEAPNDPFGDPQRREALAHAILGAAESLGDWWLNHDEVLSPEAPCRELMNFMWLGVGGLVTGRAWDEREFAF